MSDQTSMASLNAASAERTAHEISAHDYHHQRLADEQGHSTMTYRKPKRTEVN